MLKANISLHLDAASASITCCVLHLVFPGGLVGWLFWLGLFIALTCLFPWIIKFFFLFLLFINYRFKRKITEKKRREPRKNYLVQSQTHQLLLWLIG